MLGTFSPQAEPYTHLLPEEVTPSGFLARGNYFAKTKTRAKIETCSFPGAAYNPYRINPAEVCEFGMDICGSNTFMIRQGFVPVGKVDSKGRAGKLSIEVNIRKGLCFPGDNLTKEYSDISANILQLSSFLKPGDEKVLKN
ncbi:hypothetical protein L1987_42467 [Smallanthus sonchifolius]|uniref:Uncharacterized protein n=1 Tax=Smallanthus sonchifolius TaxID=185202 RepID=A0ACB9GKX8_9ASTR|nr:hypothetical protein L1987_42467 [Smallanthus sonchifolius]